MIRPWQEIVAHFEEAAGVDSSLQTMFSLAQKIASGPLATGLYGWTSMHDLCITQTPVTYPYNGPLLRLHPMPDGQIEFRYVDTLVEHEQWRRVENAGDATTRLLKFLDQLRWFPAELLKQ